MEDKVLKISVDINDSNLTLLYTLPFTYTVMDPSLRLLVREIDKKLYTKYLSKKIRVERLLHITKQYDIQKEAYKGLYDYSGNI